jgi:ABC-type Fe3+/spermidine/putrescine transport system ATPase subunit/predicted RNA-binding protein associated with RNAse of E/G family
MESPCPPLLEISQLSKRFGATVAVDEVSLTVCDGEIVTLLGPSGCGKTTLLRLIAGLEQPDKGSVRFAGRDLANVPVHQRGFGFMFQDYALFPHRNVAQNVAFGLRMANLRPDVIGERVAEVLELVGLAGLAEREISALSGGEQQRVALARSLAPNPQLLLLDEPLGSLDRALRERLMNEVRGILKRVGVTAITVTHDQQEAFALADRVVVLERGRALQAGKPEEVYRHPTSPIVARFLGLTNLLEGEVVEREAGIVRTAIGPLAIPGAETGKGRVMVLVRPEAAATCARDDTIPLEATLTAASFRGQHYQVEVSCPEGILLSFALRASPDELPALGEIIQLHLDPRGITVLAAEGGAPETVTVYKTDVHGEPVVRYTGEVLARTATSITLQAIFRRGPVTVEGLDLNPGDRFVEHFYADRWYNVFEIYDKESGDLKGWYCNITRPAVIGRESVSADDLALDLVVSSKDGAVLVDEDEFEALSLSSDEREAALEAVEQLRALADRGELPRTQ